MDGRSFRDKYAIEFAKRFTTQGQVAYLLETAGVDIALVAPFGGAPLEYWRNLLVSLDQGLAVEDGIERLLAAASKQYPGSRELKEALSIARGLFPDHGPVDGGGRPDPGLESAGRTGDGGIDCRDPDVFISYASSEREAVLDIAGRMRARHKRIWIDVWCLPAGRNFIDVLDGVLKTVRCCAVFIGPGGVNPWHRMEMNAAVQACVHDSRKSLIPVILPGGSPSMLPAFAAQYSYVTFPTLPDAAALDQLLRGC